MILLLNISDPATVSGFRPSFGHIRVVEVRFPPFQAKIGFSAFEPLNCTKALSAIVVTLEGRLIPAPSVLDGAVLNHVQTVPYSPHTVIVQNRNASSVNGWDVRRQAYQQSYQPPEDHPTGSYNSVAGRLEGDFDEDHRTPAYSQMLFC